MKCYYINLQRASDRREEIERSFACTAGTGWSLHRFPAIDARELRPDEVPGSLRAAEKACFLSHREVLRKNLLDTSPVLVLEDDAIFSSQTFRAIEECLGNDPEERWDITFTDVAIPDVDSMVVAVRTRQHWEDQLRSSPHTTFRWIDLARINFAGATAYVVSGRFKSKLVRLLESVGELNAPYDIFIRQLTHAGHVRARCIFPFVTSVSPLGSSSQIQEASGRTEVVWNTFRRLMWVDRKVAQERAVLEDIARDLCDDESRAFGTIFAAMVSRKFVSK